MNILDYAIGTFFKTGGEDRMELVCFMENPHHAVMRRVTRDWDKNQVYVYDGNGKCVWGSAVNRNADWNIVGLYHTKLYINVLFDDDMYYTESYHDITEARKGQRREGIKFIKQIETDLI